MYRVKMDPAYRRLHAAEAILAGFIGREEGLKGELRFAQTRIEKAKKPEIEMVPARDRRSRDPARGGGLRNQAGHGDAGAGQGGAPARRSLSAHGLPGHATRATEVRLGSEAAPGQRTVL